jgi:hypothetical protein
MAANFKVGWSLFRRRQNLAVGGELFGRSHYSVMVMPMAPPIVPMSAYQARSRLQHESRVSMNTGKIAGGCALYMRMVDSPASYNLGQAFRPMHIMSWNPSFLHGSKSRKCSGDSPIQPHIIISNKGPLVQCIRNRHQNVCQA